MVYGIGQADNILDSPQVAMPTYTNGSLSTEQYPCAYSYPDLFKYPEQIPLGAYDYPGNAYPQDYDKVKEPYVADTQHNSAGEFTDMELCMIVVALLLITAGLVLFRGGADNGKL